MQYNVHCKITSAHCLAWWPHRNDPFLSLNLSRSSLHRSPRNGPSFPGPQPGHIFSLALALPSGWNALFPHPWPEAHSLQTVFQGSLSYPPPSPLLPVLPRQGPSLTCSPHCVMTAKYTVHCIPPPQKGRVLSMLFTALSPLPKLSLAYSRCSIILKDVSVGKHLCFLNLKENVFPG